MKTFKLILVLVALGSLMLVACGGGGKKVDNSPPKLWEPDWYMLDNNPDYVYLYGFAERANRSLAETAAEANANQQASMFVERRVSSMMKNFEEEAGVNDPEVVAATTNLVKVVSDQKFSGLRKTNREIRGPVDGKYQAWVQLALPQETINRDLAGKINQEAAYSRFRSTQAFEELERAIQNY